MFKFSIVSRATLVLSLDLQTPACLGTGRRERGKHRVSTVRAQRRRGQPHPTVRPCPKPMTRGNEVPTFVGSCVTGVGEACVKIEPVMQ